MYIIEIYFIFSIYLWPFFTQVREPTKISQTPILDQSIDLRRVMGALEKLPNRRKVRQRLSNANKGKHEAKLEGIERRFLLYCGSTLSRGTLNRDSYLNSW